MHLQQVTSLTMVGSAERIRQVARRQVVEESFGSWLGYIRGLTRLTQEETAEQAAISLDAVRRLESGQLPGSSYLVALLSWFSQQTDEKVISAFADWPKRLLDLGILARATGLSKRPPKSKAARAKIEKQKRAVPAQKKKAS